MIDNVEQLWSWVDNCTSLRGKRTIHSVVVMLTMWVVWKYRNAKVFGDNSYRRDMLFDSTVALSFNWYSSLNCKSLKTWNGWMMNTLVN